MDGQLLATPEDSPGIIGHRANWEWLTADAATPAGAYLLVGPRGVGKSLVARRFAERLVCPQLGAHIGECSSCRRARSGHHPDVVLVSPTQRQRIGVGDARSLVAHASRTPVEAARKVFIIDREMTEAAANVLLKTLEETTASTVIVLVAASTEDLPKTVASRCRTFHFRKVDTGELREALVERGMQPAEAEVIAEVANGRPGMALRLTGKTAAAEFRAAWLEQAARLAERDHLGAGEALIMVDEILTHGERMLDQVRPTKKASGQQREQAQRETRRQRRLLWVAGLEIMAAWYVDAAARALGGPTRTLGEKARLLSVDPARALRAADLILGAGAELSTVNLRPRARLAELFCQVVEL